MSNHANIDDNLDALVAHAVSEPTVFVCGSGISIPPPACLPSAGNMVDIVVSKLAPEAAMPDERHAILNGLPEVFYQGLFGLLGPIAVQPWTALTHHMREPAAFPYRVGPTAGHLVVAYLSWRHGIPIITTNFDTHFESAARAIGLCPTVCLPLPRTEWKVARPDHSEVAIWKIHGSADQPDSICTTLEQMSRLNWPLLYQLRDLFALYRPTLMGYSGRDVDLFPFVASFSFHHDLPAFWVCTDFPPEHGIFARPERFLGVQRSIDEFAEAVVANLVEASPMSSRLINAVHKSRRMAHAPLVREHTRHVYLQAAQRIVDDQLLPLLLNSEGDHRLLLHAVSLANVQQFTSAARNAETYLATQASTARSLWGAKAWTVSASCWHNLAKYKRSEIAARQALAIAKRNGFMAEAVHALANMDEALRMQLDLDLSFNARPVTGRAKLFALTVRFLVDTCRMRRWSRSADSQVNSVHHSLTHVILEHRIRLLAILQGGLFRLNARRFAGLLLTKRWKQIRAAAYAVGYAAGIGNALKYLKRLRHGDHGVQVAEAEGIDVESARQVFDLMGHRTGVALLLRDQADAMAGSRRYVDAAALYEEAATIARDLGNSSLELKALLGMRSCGGSIDVERVRRLVDSVETDAANEVKACVMKRLAG